MRKNFLLLLVVAVLIVSLLAFVACDKANDSDNRGVSGEETSKDNNGENVGEGGTGSGEETETKFEILADGKYDGVNVKGGRVISYSGSAADLTIPTGVTAIGDMAFYGNSTLTSVVIPKGVKAIEARAFLSCPNLASVVIPDGVESIGQNAFSDCAELVSVTIPDSVVALDTAFSDCGKLSYTEYENGKYLGNHLIDAIDSSATSFTVKAGTITVAGSAFDYFSELTTVSLPDGLKGIGVCAFEYCEKLESIALPSTVKFIGQNAFERCSALISVNIPDGVEAIGRDTFNGCTSLQ